MTSGQQESTLDTPAVLAAREGHVEGRSPWALAWRRLRRNYVALASLGVFCLLVTCCLLAPVYASHVAHRGANDANINGYIHENGKAIPVVSLTGQPIGLQWGAAGGQYILGADQLGRDLATRLLYGGENSLRVALASAAISTVISVFLALLAGYFGGLVDGVISRVFDLIWAFPVILLGIALGTALSINGFHHKILGVPLNLDAGDLWIPTAIIAFVTIPYIARPLRGQVLALREKEFIEAAISQGAGPLRIMLTELLPNIASTVLVLFTLIVANSMLTEVGLSFLGAGVQPPNASWGTILSDGQHWVATDPWFSMFPGIFIAVAVLSINIFGDGLRDALDPRAKVRIEQ